MSTQPDSHLVEAEVVVTEPTNRIIRWWNECHWQRRAILTVVTATILLSAVLGFKAGMAWNRNRQVDRNFEAAQAAAAANDWPKARNLARSVLQVRPNEFAAFRIWQKALATTNDPRSYHASGSLFSDPRATREDRLESLHALCAQAPQALALAAYGTLEEQERETPDASAALAEVLLLRGQLTMLEDILRKQPGREDHPPSQVALIRTLCAAPPTPERLQEARQIFARLITAGASTEALAALVVLADIPCGLAPAPDMPELTAWVDQQPQAKDFHRLLAINSFLGKSSELDAAIFSQAIDRFLARSPSELGAWLVANGQAQLAAKVLGEAAASDPLAFVAQARALLAANDIEEAAKLLANPTQGVDLVDRELLNIDLALLQHDEQAEILAWGRALQQAPLDISRNRFIDIAHRAELLGRQMPAERAWVAAIRAAFGRLPLYRDLMPLFGSLTEQNRSGDLLELFRILLRFEPQNLELKNNYYLALIHGVDPPQEAMQRFQQLAAENPDISSFASGAAMAALMAEQPKEAIKSIQYISTTDRTAMMRAALLGTALLVDGDAQAARPLLANVDWSRFLLQERIIFRQLQTATHTADLPLPELRLPPTDDNSLEWQRAMKRSDQAQEILPSLPPLQLPAGE